MKWQKNIGIDVHDTPEHAQYISLLAGKVREVLVQRLSLTAHDVGIEMSCTVYQDVLRANQHCRQLLKGIKVTTLNIIFIVINDILGEERDL